MKESLWKDPIEHSPKEGYYLALCRLLAGPMRPPEMVVRDFWYNPRKGWIETASNGQEFEIVKFISMTRLDDVTGSEIEKIKKDFDKKCLRS